MEEVTFFCDEEEEEAVGEAEEFLFVGVGRESAGLEGVAEGGVISEEVRAEDFDGVGDAWA